jgi:hypothetical protein
MSGGEVAGLAAAGALAVYAKAQGPKCPFHRAVLVLSSAAFVGDVVYILYKRGLLKKLGLGGDGRSGGKGYSNGVKGSIMELVRKNIQELEPYRCARDDYSEGILLDANENSFGSALPDDLHHMELERYPDPYQMDLKHKIAKYRCAGLLLGRRKRLEAACLPVFSCARSPGPAGVLSRSRSLWGWAVMRRST